MADVSWREEFTMERPPPMPMGAKEDGGRIDLGGGRWRINLTVFSPQDLDTLEHECPLERGCVVMSAARNDAHAPTRNRIVVRIGHPFRPEPPGPSIGGATIGNNGGTSRSSGSSPLQRIRQTADGPWESGRMDLSAGEEL